MEDKSGKSEQEVNENLTMLLGQAWKQIELLRSLKTTMADRFDRHDERITEVHKDVAALEMAMRDVKSTMATKDDIATLKTAQTEQGQKLDQILQLLQQKPNE